MNFDLDDALGSDDSFFEEPKALSKRSSIKSTDKKSVENLFNLLEGKEGDDGNKSVPEASQKSKTIVKFDESTIKSDIFPKTNISEISEKSQKKKNYDWLGESEDINVHGKQTKNTDFLDDLLGPRSVSPKEKKIVLSENIPKDSQSKAITQSSASGKELTDATSNFSLLSNTSRERRRLRRGSSTGLEDALGLFGDEKKSENLFNKDTKSLDSKTTIDTEKGIPDWLGGTSTSSTKIDVETIRKTEEPIKNNTNEVPSNQTAKEHTQESKNISENPIDHDVPTAVKQQQIDLQNTYSSLQQQETFLLISLQLKKYEDNLETIKQQQREILEKQEKRFSTILDKYSSRQQVIENNIRLQQERLNNHMQLLISQPFKNTVTDKEYDNSDELKKSHEENDIKHLIDTLKQRHSEELFVMEESYKKQIYLLEKSSETIEERLKSEINHITTIFEEKINTVSKNYDEEINFYKQKLEAVKEQHSKDIELIKEHHSRVLDEMKTEHATHIEYMKQFTKQENELLSNSQLYSQKLDTSIEILTNSSQVLQGVQQKINQDSDIMSAARLSSIESKEKEIILMRNNLEKCREAAENERSQLLALIRSLETKIAEQNVNTQEDRWSLQQVAATLAAKSTALDREMEYNRTVNEREREQLKTLKESLLAEQEKIVIQLTEEKLKLSAEKARIETASKLTNNYETDRIKAEAEMAIQVAKDLSEKVNQERDYLYRQKSDIESLRRELADRGRELQDKEINLEYLLQSTQKKINEDKKIINEAKKLENKYKERLHELQNQWASLADREKKLAEEKVLMSKERLTLYTTMKQIKNCALCKANNLPVHNNYYMEENPSTLKISDGIRIRLDAFEDEKSSEVSKEENNMS